MKARKEILSKLRHNKPTSGDLPMIPDFALAVNSLTDMFVVNANLVGSRTHIVGSYIEIEDYIGAHFPNAMRKISCIEEIKGSFPLSAHKTPRELEGIDLAILPSKMGVAENGAVWIDETSSKLRILPFITQHLIVVLSAENIVENMHLAYNQININATGFAAWIAGPSKTADIEQTLVVGAQGARSLTVLILS